ncbi:hypothetical protein OCV73_02245 [Barnesiella propionica]|uniref:hypothetical protein n=1 Tax=Barnesiella propionica TaxID=2981781 RepID=UPI0011C89FD3|nr:hypothetical protein [Barnesiella propionica]MCU6767780.1 hypothetical protein [Barnesiella propionica]
MSEASIFAFNRKQSITDNRIKNIFWYIGECYILLRNDKAQYSKTYVKEHTTIHFEDFLRFRFVEDYLTKNKDILKARTSELDEINFTSETQKEYIDQIDYKQKPDKIDIFINKLGLAQTWGECEDKIYFAIECKRINNISDTNHYIRDLIKFTNRSYIELRLPFEGQLGFIESSSLSDQQIVEDINNKLERSSCITTEQLLKSCPINPNISTTYKSIHKRNSNKKEVFSIYHIFLDYSNIVTN